MAQEIEDGVVRIRPDFTGFATRLSAGIKAAEKQAAALKVGLKVDGRGLLTQVRAAVSTITASNIKVGLAVDSRGLLTSVRQAVGAISNSANVRVKVQPQVDAAGLRTSLMTAAAGMRGIRIKVPLDVDARDLRRQIEVALRGTFTMPAPRPAAGGGGNNDLRERSRLLDEVFGKSQRLKIIDWGAPGLRPFQALGVAIAALSPALIAMASSATFASTSLTALGPAAIGVAGAITAVTMAFTSVTDYMSQYEAVQKSAVQTAAQAGEQELQRASAIRSALWGEQSARRGLTDAVYELGDARKNLNQEERIALRNLQDLRELSSDLARDENSAKTDLIAARKELQDINENFWASDIERAQARDRVAEAEDRLSDIQRDRRRNAEDLADAEKKGVRGADNVVAARNRIRNAEDGVKEAQTRLADSIADLADAQKRSTAETAGGSAAANELARQWALMSPAARDLATWLKDNQGLMRGFRHEMEQAVLPGFLTFLKRITDTNKGRKKSVLSLLVDGAAQMGRVVGRTVALLGKAMDSKWFRKAWAGINRENERAFTNFSDTIVVLFKPVVRLFDAAAPQLTRFSQWVEDIVTTFATWVGSFSDQELKDYFKGAGDELAKWWAIAENIVVGLTNILKISLPTGQDLVSRLRDMTAEFREWTKSKQGQDQIKRFFDYVKNIPYGTIAKIVGQVALLFGAFKVAGFVLNHPVFTLLTMLAAKYPDETARFLQRATEALGSILKYLDEHPDSATALVGVLAAYKGLNVLRGLQLPPLTPVTAALGPILAIATAVGLIYELLGKPFEWDPVEDAKQMWKSFLTALKEEVNGATLGEISNFFGQTFPNWLSGRQGGWSGLGDYLGEQFSVAGWFGAKGLMDGLGITWLWNKLTEWGNAIIDWVKDIFGINSPSTVFAGMGGDLVRGLWSGFTSIWATITGPFLTFIDNSIIGRAAAAFAAGAERIKQAFAAPFATLTAALGPHISKAFSWLDKVFLTPLNATLAAVGITDAIPSIGKAANKAISDIAKIINGGNGPRATPASGIAPGKADGGKVWGNSAHNRADDIDARLTANEFVMPVKAVQKYGVGFMEQVRHGRFADGGTAMPAAMIKRLGWAGRVTSAASVKAGDPTAIAGRLADALAPVQEYRGPVPKGLGDVGGLGATILGAFMDLHKTFGDARVSSGLRKTYTSSGNKSNHWYGRAVDISPHTMAMFDYLHDKYRTSARELIYAPAANRNVWHGKPHRYSSGVLSDHWDHIHFALAQGGLVNRMGIKKYDTGGHLEPGLTLAYNGTGQRETVRTAAQEKAVASDFMRLDRRDLTHLAGLISTAVGGQMITMDGRKVAEVVSGYTYLPGGF